MYFTSYTPDQCARAIRYLLQVARHAFSRIRFIASQNGNSMNTSRNVSHYSDIRAQNDRTRQRRADAAVTLRDVMPFDGAPGSLSR